jgi:hypothetical protein
MGMVMILSVMMVRVSHNVASSLESEDFLSYRALAT